MFKKIARVALVLQICTIIPYDARGIVEYKLEQNRDQSAHCHENDIKTKSQ